MLEVLLMCRIWSRRRNLLSSSFQQKTMLKVRRRPSFDSVTYPKKYKAYFLSFHDVKCHSICNSTSFKKGNLSLEFLNFDNLQRCHLLSLPSIKLSSHCLDFTEEMNFTSIFKSPVKPNLCHIDHSKDPEIMLDVGWWS